MSKDGDTRKSISKGSSHHSDGDNTRKSILKGSSHDGDNNTRKSISRESNSDTQKFGDGDTRKSISKGPSDSDTHKKRDSKGVNLTIRTPDGKINDAAPSPANRRRVAVTDSDGKEKQKGILKNGGDKKGKEGQRRRVAKPQDSGGTNKKPKLKKKSAFEKLGQMLGLGAGHVVINDPYALEVKTSSRRKIVHRIIFSLP